MRWYKKNEKSDNANRYRKSWNYRIYFLGISGFLFWQWQCVVLWANLALRTKGKQNLVRLVSHKKHTSTNQSTDDKYKEKCPEKYFSPTYTNNTKPWCTLCLLLSQGWRKTEPVWNNLSWDQENWGRTKRTIHLWRLLCYLFLRKQYPPPKRDCSCS